MKPRFSPDVRGLYRRARTRIRLDAGSFDDIPISVSSEPKIDIPEVDIAQMPVSRQGGPAPAAIRTQDIGMRNVFSDDRRT